MLATLRSYLRSLRGLHNLDDDLDEEFQTHMALRTDDLVRSGKTPEAARRLARLEFGLPEQARQRSRQALGLVHVDRVLMSWLDFKLGIRMLVRYPALTIVAAVALAFGIASGLTTFAFVKQALDPDMPLAEGDRMVGIRIWNNATSRPQQITPAQVEAWRGEVKGLEHLGAFRTFQQNLRVAGQPYGEPIAIAAMSVSGFDMARVPPLLGRTLVESDEAPGAPRVVVLGYEAWRSRLAGDSMVVGHRVSLGASEYTVVGVMPPGFAFPISHDAWVPLNLNEGAVGDPSLFRAFGRLRQGSSIEEVQAQLLLRPVSNPSMQPDTLARLTPQLLPYARSIFDISLIESRLMKSLNVVAVMFLLLICGNVAMLMFTRAAAREREIVVRKALGATGARIVMQLVAEALVLGALAAVAGIAAARRVLHEMLGVIEKDQGRLPFWVSDSLTAATIWYAVLLTVLVAVVTGALPAVKLLRSMGDRLKEQSSGGSWRFGGVWTAVIVAQIAVTCAFPASTFFALRDLHQIRSLEPGFSEEEFLSVRLDFDDAPGVVSSEERDVEASIWMEELRRRVAEEPGVSGVTFTNVLPRKRHERVRVEVDGLDALGDDDSQLANTAWVDREYFDVLGAQVQGRGFSSSDAALPADAHAQAVIVNQAFARTILEGRQAIGRRVRYTGLKGLGGADSVGPWLEIVGVAPDLAMHDGGDPTNSGAGIYHAARVGGQLTPIAIIRAYGRDPASLSNRLREIAAAITPSLRLSAFVTLDRVHDAEESSGRLWVLLLVAASSLGMVLSLAGIYSVMAFTVARRRREIGIRVALGSDRKRVVAAVLSRPFRQVALGVIAGGILVGLLSFTILGTPTAFEGMILVAYAILMLGVCLTAGVVPLQRVLRVEPTEALRVDL